MFHGRKNCFPLYFLFCLVYCFGSAFFTSKKGRLKMKKKICDIVLKGFYLGSSKEGDEEYDIYFHEGFFCFLKAIDGNSESYKTLTLHELCQKVFGDDIPL